MKAAIVRQAGETPIYGEFESPAATAREHLIRVTAAAISQITRGRASGRHYSSSGAFPFVPGIDGVGRCEDGSRVYFVLPRTPYGAMAEQTVVPASRCLPLPDDLDDVTAAALANPGMSSWAALRERAKLRAGETVLINGATGIAGRLAVQIAKHLGASRVIATGRNTDALESLAALGADVTISLIGDDDALEKSFKPHFAEGIDVVLDYLWGRSAERLLISAAKAGAEARPIRFVQIGSVSGGDVALPSAVLRASAIELMGSGIGSIALERLVAATAELLQAAIPAGLEIAVDPIPLVDIAQGWSRNNSAHRTVVLP
jgi:NADPH:quinone reductase-like Zn-dependent oxidoreductase